MTILGIDTSNQSMSLCLGEDNNLLGSYFTSVQKNHSVTLMPAIDFLMTSNNKQPKDLTKIIVAKGPGSYTGLRIGVTTAKTLAWTLGIDLYAVSSLALMAESKKEFDGLIVPIMNARRENVYTGAYQWQNGRLITVIEDHHTSLETWLNQLNNQKEAVFLIGSDLSVFADNLADLKGSKITYSKDKISNEINPTSFLTLENQSVKVEDIEGFIPDYLKRVEAEEKWLETHGPNEVSNYVERV